MGIDATTIKRILDEQPVHEFDRESIEAELGDRNVVGMYRLQILADGGSNTTCSAHEDMKAELLSRLDGTYDKPAPPQGQYQYWCYLPADEMDRQLRLRQLL